MEVASHGSLRHFRVTVAQRLDNLQAIRRGLGSDAAAVEGEEYERLRRKLQEVDCIDSPKVARKASDWTRPPLRHVVDWPSLDVREPAIAVPL